MKRQTILKILIGCVLTILSACGPAVVDETFLQVASPDWRDQRIYFLMTDRFNNGNTANDKQMPNGEESGSENIKWNGGDLQGIIDQLDYIKGMGFTAIWITPPVYNQWWDANIPYSGFHGYWASSFIEVDPHYGTLQDYKRLSVELHKRGMYLIQDIVCNHTANYFKMTNVNGKIFVNTNGYTVYPKDPFLSNSIAYYVKNGYTGTSNEVNAYHWTPDIVNWNDWNQMSNYQSSSLDDINTENPYMIKKMKQWYSFWIREVGVDGFRMDTAKNVPASFWRDFCYSKDGANPGMREYAKLFKKEDFIMFGEVHTPGAENEDAQAGSYTKSVDGSPVMDTVIYYPMFSAIQKVFQKGEKTSNIKTLFDNQTYYRSDSIPKLVTFIDNHDKPRFINGNSKAKLQLALMFIYTSMGIPCVYYGTEQNFDEPRQAMFKDGYHGGMTNKDYFVTNTDMYRFLKKVNAMRAKYDALRRGTQTIRYSEDTGAGLLAYTRELNGKNIIIIFNTSSSDKFAASIPTGYTSKQIMVNLLSNKQKITNMSDGTISGVFPAQSVKIFIPEADYLDY